MATPEQLELVATFSSVTGADAVTAQHVLEAHAWDLNNGVEFFLEQGAHPCPPSLQGHPVSIDEEFDQDEEPQGRAAQPVSPTIALPDSPPVQGRLPVASHVLRQDHDQDDEMLRRALNESVRSSGGAAAAHAGGQSQMPELIDNDGVEDDVEIIENTSRNIRQINGVQGHSTSRSTAQNGSASTSGGAIIDIDDDMEDAPAMRQRRSRPRGAAAAAGRDLDALQELGRRLGVPDLEAMQMPAVRPTGRRLPESLAAQFAGAGARHLPDDEEELQLPDGINVEEARMLEAAMLGIPYEGRMPRIDEPWQPAAPPAPEVIAQRQLREEQDVAYQASLLADMEKAQTAERAKQEALAAQQRAAEEASVAEEAQRAEERLISEKRSGLPAEPPLDDPDAITVLVRLPNGGRPSRRFTRDTKVSILFNWVDVNVAPEIKPGTFRLVTPFPRRMLLADTLGSLEASGLTQKQEAVFLEPI